MKTLELTPRARGVKGEMAFQLMPRIAALRNAGTDVAGLQVGEPHIPTFPFIIDELKAALDRGETHYTAPGGDDKMRDAVARAVTERTGVATERGNVVVTPGSKLILEFAMEALINPGDEVLVPDPGYSAYNSLVRWVGGKPVSVPLLEANDFRIDVGKLESLVTDRTKMLILCSPSNPTGGTLTKEDCVAIAELAVKRDFWIVSDEIYGKLIFEGDHASVYSLSELADRIIMTDGMSKAYAFCGGRLGWGVMREDLASVMIKIAGMSHSCPAQFVQSAARIALESPLAVPEMAAMMEYLTENREATITGLNGIPGIRCFKPSAAFYAFPNITGTGWDDVALAEALLQAGVAVLPGSSFGEHGKGYLRLSFAGKGPEIEKGINRIGEFLSRHEAPVPTRSSSEAVPITSPSA